MSNLQMANFVGSNDNPAEATCILDNGDTVYLFQSLVNHTRSADIRES